MDRVLVYPGALPQDTDMLSAYQDAMVGVGAALQAVFGTGTYVFGLAGTQTSPASLNINIGPGSILSLQDVDANAYGSLGTNTNLLVKQGINLTATQFTLTAPTISGDSINYLIEAEFVETDTNSVVLPYYNPTSPSTPYSGPNNTGAAQNTLRTQRVGLQLKAGTPAPTGTQTTPATDAGWVPLYVITVNFGQTAITTSEITVASGAPFVSFTLPNLASPSSLTFNGWKKYPDPNSPTGYFIEQWGTTTGSTSGPVNFIFPIAFPNALLSYMAGFNFATGAAGPLTAQADGMGSTLTYIPVALVNPSGVFQGEGISVLVKGY
jgi:hypothetical protein